jgi:hypothetical protein
MRYFSLLLVLALAGCMTAQTPSVRSQSGNEYSGHAGNIVGLPSLPVLANDAGGALSYPRAPSENLVVLTPATHITRQQTSHYIPSETYTRFTVTSYNGSGTSQGGKVELYPYKMRSGVERLFVGTHHSASLSLTLVSGGFTATVPVLTITHDSTRSGGEVFSRVLRHEAMDFPMFLVRGSTTSDVASVTVDLKGDDSIASSAAGSALSAVVDATKLLGAPPALVTTLSANSTRQLATTIDNAINKLFSKSIEERQLLDHSIRAWQPIIVALRLPRHQGHWNRRKLEAAPGSRWLDDLDYVPIGTWTVTFQTPRVSAFSAVEVDCGEATDDGGCKARLGAAVTAARTDVANRYAEVLVFPLIRDGSLGTITAYLRQQDWWTPGLKGLDTKDGDVGQFCRQLKSSITDIGFNVLDASLVLAAVRNSQLLTSAEIKKLTGVSDCN